MGRRPGIIIQTVHDRTAQAFGRGYCLDTFEQVYRRLSEAGLPVITHVILGLPGETAEDMLDTIRYLSGLHPTLSGIKLQLLQILKGTRMAQEYLQNPFPLMSMEEYTDLTVRCLKLLPPQTVIHRMTGDPPRSLLIAPQWSTDKKRILNLLHQKIKEA